ncbi:Rid family hydrolase [Acetobacter indonesiensis]
MVNAVQHSSSPSSGVMARIERIPGGIRIVGLRSADAATQAIAEQCQSALEQGAALLDVRGYSMADVTRVVATIADAAEFPTCFPTLRHIFSHQSPSLTLMWVKSLSPESVKIELELYVDADLA